MATTGPNAVEAMRLQGLRTRVESLEQAGGAAFDGGAFAFVLSLLRSAERLGGGAQTRLLTRVEERLNGLEASLQSVREKAWNQVEEMASTGAIDENVQDALTRGDYKAVLWRASRRRRTERASRPRRSAAPPSAIIPPAAAEARAVVSVARAEDDLPEVVGHYNSRVVAVRALAELARLAPGYLAAFMHQLDDVGLLKATAEPAPKAPSKTPMRAPPRGPGSKGKGAPSSKAPPKVLGKPGAQGAAKGARGPSSPPTSSSSSAPSSTQAPSATPGKSKKKGKGATTKAS